MGSHQATPEHFIRCISDIPADESSGVINVDTIQHLAQKAFPLFVNYLARPLQGIERSTNCALHMRFDDVDRIENGVNKCSHLP